MGKSNGTRRSTRHLSRLGHLGLSLLLQKIERQNRKKRTRDSSIIAIWLLLRENIRTSRTGLDSASKRSSPTCRQQRQTSPIQVDLQEDSSEPVRKTRRLTPGSIRKSSKQHPRQSWPQHP